MLSTWISRKDRNGGGTATDMSAGGRSPTHRGKLGGGRKLGSRIGCVGVRTGTMGFQTFGRFCSHCPGGKSGGGSGGAGNSASPVTLER